MTNTTNATSSQSTTEPSSEPSTVSNITSELTNLTMGGDWTQEYSGLSFFNINNFAASIEYDHILEQSDGKVNPLWVLLDNQSTCDVISNPILLKNIHRVDKSLRIFSTGGSTTTNYIGYLPGYTWVWFHHGGIANILSLARVKKKYKVTFDSQKDNLYHVHLSSSRTRSFQESDKGLYYSDMR